MDPLNILTIVISFVSLAVSIFVFIRDSWKERFNIKCEKIKWFASMADNQPFFIWMNISNNSKLPITVLKMELECIRDSKTLSAISRGEKHLVMSTESNGSKTDKYSCDYPICINGYGGFGAYIHFSSKNSHHCFEQQDVKVKIYTNRGVKKQKMRLDFGSNIFRVIQSFSSEDKTMYDSDGSPIEFQYDGV